MRKLRRIGIFVFFDPQGIVDAYVLKLLGALRPNFQKLLIISNCRPDSLSRTLLESACDELFLRKNQGLDAAAFKAGLTTFCGWQEVSSYDEVVLMNDTFFGPVHSFSEMFEEMDQKDLDFWGMSAGYQQEDGWKMSRYGYIPDHIQTFFVAFRQQMVRSQAFQDYWNHYDDTMSSFKEVVAGHEMIMTKHFEDLGFRWDIYTKSQRYRSSNREENFNLYFYRSCEMMEDLRFPVFKKKVLSSDMPELLYMNDLEDAADAMKYIGEKTDYDTGLIWDNVLRLYHMEDLYHSLHLNFVLSSQAVPCENAEEAAMVFRLTSPRYAEKILRKAAPLADLLPVYLICETSETEQAVRSSLKGGSPIRFLPASGQETDMGAFLLCCRDLCKEYTYLGYVHDVQNPNHYPASVGESTVYGFLQNMANDPHYFTQVLACFRKNPKLGVLGAPSPLHHLGFLNLEDNWDGCYEDAEKLMQKLHLSCPMAKEKQPIMKSGCFVCRTEALQGLFHRNWTPEDFKCSSVSLENQNDQVIRRILPMAAQSAGYYSGILMHENYASMRVTSQELMLKKIVSTTRKNLGLTGSTYLSYLEQLQICGTGDPEDHASVRLADLTPGFLIKYLIYRCLPERFTKKCREYLAYFKRKRR